MPVKVNGLSIICPFEEEPTVRVSDRRSVILCRMNNGAAFRIFGLRLPGHSNWYRVHGSRGAMKIPRGAGYFGPDQVRIWHEEWDFEAGDETERVYTPEWPDYSGPGQPPPSILGIREPGSEGVEFARQVWREMGYEEKTQPRVRTRMGRRLMRPQ